MTKHISIILIFLLVAGLEATAQSLEKKTFQAIRLTDNLEIKVDGYLDDIAWDQAEIATDFVQTDPVFRDPVSQKTEVRLLYTDRGIYIGAMMYDTEPGLILKELSPRDQRGNTDFFGVVFDTYRDGLNGFAFNVTASGVQQDVKISGGSEDTNWDAIWQSEVKFLDNGWSAEFFIPYLSLRFANEDVQEWNVNFMREIRRYRENVFWNPVDPSLDGFLNQAGHLNGIANIKSPIRLSVTPFVTGYINTDGFPNANIATTATPAYTGGMDLKYGINDAFTLDMTLVPDFGQVISDNQILNLGPFEVRFDENRQFFKEGTELFDKGNLFYSRRVGGRPLNFFGAFNDRQANEQIVDNPDQAQLINATKVSGRTAQGTGIGLFNAVEREEYAIIQDTLTGQQRRYKTNPYTNYNVMVVDQNLPNNSVVSLINTNVTRFGDYNANVTGAFANFKDKSQKYAAGGSVVVANQFLEQGTDTGYKYNLGLAKIGGNWRGFIDYVEESDNYNPNDLGILFSPNSREIYTNLSYNSFKPKNQKLQRWEVGITPQYSRLHTPDVFTDFAVNFNGFLLWKSRNALGFNARIEPVETFDYFEPRTRDFSKFYRFPTNWRVGGFFSSDYRKTLALDINANYRVFNEPGRTSFNTGVSPRVRVSDQLSLFLTVGYSRSLNETGYVFPFVAGSLVDGLSAGDVMIGTRDRRIFENSLRIQYIFNNKMSLGGRVRHYWDRVAYDKFGRLESDGRLTDLAFDGTGTDGDPVFDVNRNIFNIDLNYTWRFAQGSDLIFVWKNSIDGANNVLDEDYLTNFSDLFGFRQINSFSLKMVFFLDYDTIVNG